MVNPYEVANWTREDWDKYPYHGERPLVILEDVSMETQIEMLERIARQPETEEWATAGGEKGEYGAAFASLLLRVRVDLNYWALAFLGSIYRILCGKDRPNAARLEKLRYLAART